MVAREVSLERVLDGVRALEVLFAILVGICACVCVQVFVEQFPHVVGQAKDLQVFRVSASVKQVMTLFVLFLLRLHKVFYVFKEFHSLESSLELHGSSSVVLRLPHDLADESLLAFQVVVVELLIDILQHGDPLDNVER